MGPSFNRGGLQQDRLLSRPITVRWAGWETNTYRLQQAGWELSAEHDFTSMHIRLAMRHTPCQCVAITAPLAVDFYDAAYGMHAPPPATVQYFACRATVQFYEQSVSSFKPIDAAPQFVSSTMRSIEDLKWFATPLVRTEEIIVEPETVAELLEKIRKMQAPEQAAIRARERLRNLEGVEIGAVRQQQQFHAQILSFPRAA